MRNIGYIAPEVIGPLRQKLKSWHVGLILGILRRACKQRVKLPLIFLQIDMDFHRFAVLTEYSQ